MIVRFQNGEVRDLGSTYDGIVILGLDAEGYVVVRADGMTYALTRCCHASAKGCGPYSDDDEGYIGCRACYAEVDPKLGGEPDPVVVPVVPAGDPKLGGTAAPTDPVSAPAPAVSTASQKGTRMTRSKATPAAEQFAALGLTDPAVFTDAMRLAIKQKWANLPIDQKVDDLRAALAAVVVEATPDAAALAADPEFQNAHGPADSAVINTAQAEAHRRVRNAKVNAWRKRNQIQAALDARALKFAAMRAGKTAKAAAPVLATAV